MTISNNPIGIPTFLVSVFVLIQICRSAFPIAKPGCQDHCGNVSIPYPFGMNSGCFMAGDQFNVKCNNVTNKPSIRGTEIRSISLEGQLRISYEVVSDCYGASGVRDANTSPQTSLFLAMILNNTANKFTAIGCDTLSLLMSSSDNLDYSEFGVYTGGCMSVCTSKKDVVNGSCSGIGCCQTTIASQLWLFESSISLGSLYNHTLVSDFNPCSYAFVVEESSFQFSLDLLTSINMFSSSQQYWTGWLQLTSRVPRRNRTVQHTHANPRIVNVMTKMGPLGTDGCKDGFQGNPYLPVNGCQDINECASSTHICPIDSACLNTLGSYICRCNAGYLEIKSGRNGTDTFCQPPNKKAYWPIVAGQFISFLLAIVSVTKH